MRLPLLLALLLMFSSLSPVQANAGDLAIIVNKHNTLQDLLFGDLARMFKQEQQFWEGGERIYLIMRETGAPEQVLIAQKVYRMEEGELKKYLLQKVFSGEIRSFPKTVASNEAVKRFVSQVPNAVGFIDAKFADETVKILRIDGKLPGEPGYPLAE